MRIAKYISNSGYCSRRDAEKLIFDSKVYINDILCKKPNVNVNHNDKIIIEKKYRPSLILTGGLANIFKDQIIMKSCYEPYLTLEGLYLIGLKKYA